MKHVLTGKTHLSKTGARPKNGEIVLISPMKNGHPGERLLVGMAFRHPAMAG